MTYAPTVHIVDAPAFGTVLVSIEHDCEVARGGMLRLSLEALALPPEAVAKAVDAHKAGES